MIGGTIDPKTEYTVHCEGTNTLITTITTTTTTTHNTSS